MIYIYTEDEKEGLILAKNAVDLYLSAHNIVVDTFNGISNLVSHIQSLVLNNNDRVYYIADNIKDNKSIQAHLTNALNLINNTGLVDRVNILEIVCCEYALITALRMEYFAKTEYIEEILSILEIDDSNDLTVYTKNMDIFDKYYDSLRKDKKARLDSALRKGYIPGYTQQDVEDSVTVEKLCKKLKALVLQCGLDIDRQFGDCWENNCCIKKNRVCSMHINSRPLTSDEKKQFLVDNTVYYNIIERVANENNLIMASIPMLSLDDIKLNKKAIQIINNFQSSLVTHVETYKNMALVEIDKVLQVGNTIDLEKILEDNKAIYLKNKIKTGIQNLHNSDCAREVQLKVSEPLYKNRGISYKLLKKYLLNKGYSEQEIISTVTIMLNLI